MVGVENFAFVQAKLEHSGEHAMFIVDMDAPGVECLRVPAYSHTYAHHHWEMAFRDVVVPASNLIGNEGDGALTELAETSGGRALSPRGRTFELANICNEIVKNLKNQYLIGYRSTNDSRDGKWRNVRVKLDPPNNVKLNVRSRTGYYARNDNP